MCFQKFQRGFLLKAFVYSGKGNMGIKEMEKPRFPEGGALARVICASICGTDLRTYGFGNTSIRLRLLGIRFKLLLEYLFVVCIVLDVHRTEFGTVYSQQFPPVKP